MINDDIGNKLLNGYSADLAQFWNLTDFDIFDRIVSTDGDDYSPRQPSE